MAKKSGWELLQAGKLRAALRLLKEEHRRDLSKGTLNNLGTCHLCLGDALAAKKSFDEALVSPTPDTGTHGLAGTARWILNQFDEAVQVWCDGLDCDYRDAAGGMRLPLLLFYASARRPQTFSKTQAKKMIQEALKSSRARNWPGALGRYVLKQIDEKQTRIEAQFDHPIVTARQLNQVEFYAGVMAYLQEDNEQFVDRMRRCALGRECEFNCEWHLARYEAGRFEK